MHVVRFQGGFANQLFQLCLYYKLCEDYGTERVLADISCYTKHDIHGGYKLGKIFDLKYISKLPSEYEIINEQNYNAKSYEKDKVYYYDGYWQHESYFPTDLSFLNKCFDLSKLSVENRLLVDRMRTTQSVSVHVRRGDYLNHYYHGNITTQSYIENAIGYIKSIIDDPIFFIFSDDIDWCRKNIDLDSSEVFFVSGNEEHVELDIAMMGECKHNIIANSSFSWWGQEINDYKDKIVISPEYWFNEKSSIDTLNKEAFVHISNTPEHVMAVSKPLISILVPVYNKKYELRRCMSSILNQTYSDFEVIIVDDASTDGSWEELKKYNERDNRIRLIHKDKNESLLAARLTAMEKAIGSFIIFVDSDDYLESDACMTLKEQIEKSNADYYEFAYCCEPIKKVVNKNIAFEEEVFSILKGEHPHTIWNKCYSAKLVKKTLSVVDTFYCNMTEDAFFTPILLAYAESKVHINKVLYHYIQINGMSNQKKISQTSFLDMLESISQKNIRLRSIIEKNFSNYTNLIDDYEKNDMDYIVNSFVFSNEQKAIDRVLMLRKIDEKFGYQYCDEYLSNLEEKAKKYDAFEKLGMKAKSKWYVKYLLNWVKSKVKKVEGD